MADLSNNENGEPYPKSQEIPNLLQSLHILTKYQQKCEERQNPKSEKSKHFQKGAELLFQCRDYFDKWDHEVKDKHWLIMNLNCTSEFLGEPFSRDGWKDLFEKKQGLEWNIQFINERNESEEEEEQPLYSLQYHSKISQQQSESNIPPDESFIDTDLMQQQLSNQRENSSIHHVRIMGAFPARRREVQQPCSSSSKNHDNNKKSLPLFIPTVFQRNESSEITLICTCGRHKSGEIPNGKNNRQLICDQYDSLYSPHEAQQDDAREESAGIQFDRSLLALSRWIETSPSPNYSHHIRYISAKWDDIKSRGRSLVPSR